MTEQKTYASQIKGRILNGKPGSVRAAIYARVSTDKEDQRESIPNQIELAQLYIEKHPSITLVDTFIDDAKSGKNADTRLEYMRMLVALKNNEFDLIITKSLSRLNRSESNTQRLIELAILNEVTFLTLEDEQVQDFEDMNTSLLLSIKSTLDEQYVLNQSAKGRLAHRLRCENKRLTFSSCGFGYNWNTSEKEISINPEEAEIIKEIFNDYVFSAGTPASIHAKLQKKGINLSAKSISNILANSKYIGNFYINKKTTKLRIGSQHSTRINLPKEDWVLVERPDLKIVDEDIYEMAQRIRKSRKTNFNHNPGTMTQAHFQGSHIFATKLICAECGKHYIFGYSDRAKTIGVYKLKSHSDCANSIQKIYEDDLITVTKEALTHAFKGKDEVFSSLERILTQCIQASEDNKSYIAGLESRKSKLEVQIAKLLDFVSASEALTEKSRENIQKRLNDINAEIQSVEWEIEQQRSVKLDETFISKKINEIKEAIEELRNFDEINRENVLIFLDHIDVSSTNGVRLYLKSGQIYRQDLSCGGVGKMGSQDARYS